MHARNIPTASQDVARWIYDDVFPWFIWDIKSSFLPKLSITSTASIVTGAQWALDIAMIPLQFHKGRNPGHRRPRTVMIERCDSFPGLNVNRGRNPPTRRVWGDTADWVCVFPMMVFGEVYSSVNWFTLLWFMSADENTTAGARVPVPVGPGNYVDFNYDLGFPVS